jgi:hypothetical protein
MRRWGEVRRKGMMGRNVEWERRQLTAPHTTLWY